MKLILLGSGGVSATPRPTCFCRLCEEARTKGIPFARTGPSLFVGGANLLFDTPEEIREQLNREKIKKVENIILTHWHPDHTQGIRIIEQINWNYDLKKPYYKPINLYISDYQRDLFKKYSSGSFLEYYQRKGMIKLLELADKKAIKLGNLEITPYPIKETKAFYFLIEEKNKKVIYAPCEYYKFIPDPELKNIDKFIVHNLFWENDKISRRMNKPTDEDSFEQMLEHAKSFSAKEIILTHIEESFGLSHAELDKKMKKYYKSYNIKIGYDGLKINM